MVAEVLDAVCARNSTRGNVPHHSGQALTKNLTGMSPIKPTHCVTRVIIGVTVTVLVIIYNHCTLLKLRRIANTVVIVLLFCIGYSCYSLGQTLRILITYYCEFLVFVPSKENHAAIIKPAVQNVYKPYR